MQNVAALGLTNIKLMHCDIMDVDASFGLFDYILSHGVYSWVPPPVRTKMMQIFKQNLTPDGVCYVSYNAHPFSHTRDLARDMMLFHTRDISDMKQKTGQARAIMQFLSEGSRAETVHGAIMRDQFNRVTRMPDEVLFHDDLNGIAEAFLLHRVAEQAESHGLQYLSDAEFSRRNLAGYAPDVRATLERFPDSEFMARDQYQDFLDGNGFRRTLLCHDHVALQRRVPLDFVTRFYLSGTTVPTGDDYCLTDDSPMQFKTQDGSELTVSNPLLKAAYLVLGDAWPQSLTFAELHASACARLEAGPARQAAEADAASLIESMYVLAYSGEVAFRLTAPYVPAAIGERPVASLLARKQAESGSLVTNLLHEAVRLSDESTRRFLQLLDGTRNADDLAVSMAEIAAAAREEAEAGSGADTSVAEQVQRSLATVRKLGLLVG